MQLVKLTDGCCTFRRLMLKGPSSLHWHSDYPQQCYRVTVAGLVEPPHKLTMIVVLLKKTRKVPPFGTG